MKKAHSRCWCMANENWSPQRWKNPVSTSLPGPAAFCCCRMPGSDPADVHYAAVWKPVRANSPRFRACA